MWILNTVKFSIIENFVLNCWYKFKSQNWSHIKYSYFGKILIIPKHKNMARWTLNNIFKIIAFNSWFKKETVEKEFFNFIKK